MQPHRLVSIPDDLINEIQFEIPEAPYDAVQLYLRRAICEFCEISHYWQEEVGPLTPQAGTDIYDIDAPRGASIVSVVGVSFDDAGNAVELFRDSSGQMKFRFWQPSSSAIQFAPIEELAGKSISIVAALKPEIDGNNFKFSETILRDYRDSIAAGAKAKIFMIPRKPWSDPGLAQASQVVFITGSNKALRSKGRGFSRLPDRANPVARSYY